MPKKRDEYHRQIKKIAVQVLQDEWELSFTEILATRLFGDRAAWRVEEKSPVISLAIVVTGGPEAQRPAQNQQRRRKLPPVVIGINQRRVERRKIGAPLKIRALEGTPGCVRGKRPQHGHHRQNLRPRTARRLIAFKL